MKTGKKLTRKAFLYTIISSAILAQTTGFSWAAEANDYSLDQVEVTANRMPVKVAETAANVSVITHADIEKNHYRDLGEALQQVTGVIVTKQGSAGSEQYVSLNGDPHVVIMIDGRRMNLRKLPGAFGGRATFDMSSFPSLTMIDKIEVVKGAASALYGSDATGGVINIITRKGSKSESTLDINTGSWGTRNYTYTNQGAEQGWSWFLTAGKSNQDHFAYKDSISGQTKTMENSAFDQKNLTFRLDKDLDSDHSLTLNFEHMNNHKGQPYMAAGRTLWGASLHYPYDYLNTVTNNWAITYNTKKDQLADSYVRIYQNYYSYNMNQYVGSKWSASKYNNNQQGLEWKDGWQLGDNQTLVGGAEWIKTKVDYPGYFTNKSIDNKAVYLEDRVALSDKWTFTPGVRYDHQNM
ncbi:MAG: TonB-dependent receptor plug domain-containing protein, partial [Sporomusaceae bacterium]|nr:TonB-dependent receptor plug domain-containing protein [Sporomusaceae bacterium]